MGQVEVRKVGDGSRGRLRLGRLVATHGALDTIPRDVLAAALARHEAHDWCEVCPEDKAANDEAATSDGRILSAYSHGGMKFWIITEGDRSATTTLLPEDY